jgi:hypothetical protein
MARPQLPLWLFPHLNVRPPPPDPLTVYMIAQRHAGIGTNAFVPIFLSLLGRLGRSNLAQKANPAEK